MRNALAVRDFSAGRNSVPSAHGGEAYIALCVYISLRSDTSGDTMRTEIEIDDELMAKAMQLSGFSTKRETVEAALRLLVQLKLQEPIRNYRGKLASEGDLEEMRLDRRS